MKKYSAWLQKKLSMYQRVSAPCQVLSVGVCIANIISKGIKQKRKIIRSDWIKFIYTVSFTWVLGFNMLAQIPGEDVNIVN